jgi:hypothetical protein
LSGLLTSGAELQIEGWLGEGDLVFTNIFTKLAGDGQTSFDFHNTLDGKRWHGKVGDVPQRPAAAAHTTPALLGDFPDHPTRIAGSKYTVWDVSRHYAPGSDHGPGPNPHARTDDPAAADPAV